MDDVVLFSECSIDDAKIIGKKAAHLAELYSKGFTIPPGFVISGNLFVKFIEMTHLKERIAEILISSMDTEQKALQIQQIILNTPFPEDLSAFIYQSYTSLGGQQSSNESSNEPYVALRVSSTSDYVEDAFFLNIKGKERLISGLKSCWASLFNAKNLPLKRFKPAVIVQRMANPITSGMVYSYNPITGNQNEMLILVSSGLANIITLQQTIPSMYIINKDNFSVKHSIIQGQTVQYALSLQKERTERIQLQEPVKNILDEYILQEIAKLATKVESRLNIPQCVSFAIEKQLLLIGSKMIDRDDFKKRYADHFFTDELLGIQKPVEPVAPEQSEQFVQSTQQELQEQSNFGEQAAYAPDTMQQTEQRSQFTPSQSSSPVEQPQYSPEQPQFQQEQTQPEPVAPTFYHEQQEPVVQQQQSVPEQNSLPSQEEQSSFIQFQDYAKPTEQQEKPQYFEHEQSQFEQHREQQSEQLVQHNSEPVINQVQENNSSEIDDDILQHYEPEVHYPNPEQSPVEQSIVPEQTKEHFVQEHIQTASRTFHDIMFSASSIVANCDVAIVSLLKNKYKSIFGTAAPDQFGRLLHELKQKMNVPLEREIIVIRKLRDDFLDSGRSLSPQEVEYCLNYTKQFLEGM